MQDVFQKIIAEIEETQDRYREMYFARNERAEALAVHVLSLAINAVKRHAPAEPPEEFRWPAETGEAGA